jgi:tRNA A37 N6-isopentenylltransferase MiaA
MVADGLVDEVRQLRADGYGSTRAMGSLGYAQINAALENDIPLDAAIQSVKTLTKRYAKNS